MMQELYRALKQQSGEKVHLRSEMDMERTAYGFTYTM